MRKSEIAASAKAFGLKCTRQQVSTAFDLLEFLDAQHARCFGWKRRACCRDGRIAVDIALVTPSLISIKRRIMSGFRCGFVSLEEIAQHWSELGSGRRIAA